MSELELTENIINNMDGGSSYPKISDPNFNKKITQKYNKYRIPKKRKTFKQVCFANKFELQQPQKFVPAYINPKTPYKGILIYHRIGAGKTCTAVNVGETWKNHRKIIVVVPASLINNFRGELRSQCAGNNYLTNAERLELNNLHPTSERYKEIIQKSDDRINKYYSIYSYHKFTELAKDDNISLRNSVLIIDEIQNMVSEGGSFYTNLYNIIKSAPDSLRIVLLSATPMFDKPGEIALTMNLLNLVNEIPIGTEFERNFIKITKNRKNVYSYSAKNLDIFKGYLKGYVSYFRGAPPYVFPETPIKFVKCEMSDFQYQSYISVLDKEKKENKENEIMRKMRLFRKGDILNLPTNFFIGARLISNVAFPNKGIRETGASSFKGKYLSLDNLETYSVKFFKIYKRIQKASGPVFVYSNFLEYGGLKSFAKVLEAQGWRNYAIYGEGHKTFAIMSGDESQQMKEEIKNVYNQPKNINGSKLKILLISSAIKEGYSFKSVRQAHILEPYWNWSRILQIIGRSSRFCSHKDLEEDKRVCNVYIYLATREEEDETIDEYIAKLSKSKDKLINEFETAMKEISVDCDLNYYANVFPEFGETLKCDK